MLLYAYNVCVLCTYIHYVITIHMYTCIALRGVFTSVLEESQGFTTFMLLLAMITLHMLTFRWMVTMVAEFCSLVILIHNTLLGEITISSTRTTRVNNIIPST